MTIKILVVDDQALFREGLRTLLSVYEDFEVVGEAANGEEALRLAVQLHPDVVLMDLRMPVLDGVRTTSLLKESLPSCKVIVLTTFDDDELVFDGLRAGAIGYLLKDVSSSKLVEAIRAASRGEYFLLPAITAKVIAEFSKIPRSTSNRTPEMIDALSPRELEILLLVASGDSNKEIAEKLVISEGTVKNHLSSILSKLNARDRLQAVIRARELGIIP
ncbi:two component transcriptional regulator, LuxR family [Anaerolinea thermolimosa]|uniref:response regulator n=1 Tax=Anaerolinea thermolimosa TaxID=229919 RepID=UPI0007844005|nr:response regulator transcription factor [Anaerolinea thermolimosa]GAP06463.1 two component transcriptional regulator, LuxR family [Anaerolinea thermolimosa]